MALRSVDLPEEEPPTIATSSPSVKVSCTQVTLALTCDKVVNAYVDVREPVLLLHCGHGDASMEPSGGGLRICEGQGRTRERWVCLNIHWQ